MFPQMLQEVWLKAGVAGGLEGALSHCPPKHTGAYGCNKLSHPHWAITVSQFLNFMPFESQ